jgi:hypothetical protein
MAAALPPGAGAGVLVPPPGLVPMGTPPSPGGAPPGGAPPPYLAGSTLRARAAVRQRAIASGAQHQSVLHRHRAAVDQAEAKAAEEYSLTNRRVALGYPPVFRADPVPPTQYRLGQVAPRIPLDECRPPPFRPPPLDALTGSRRVSEACLEALVSPRDLQRLAATAPQAKVTLGGVTPVQLAQLRLEDELYASIDHLALAGHEHAAGPHGGPHGEPAVDLNWMLARMAAPSYPPDGLLENGAHGAPSELMPPLPWRSSIRDRALTQRFRRGGLDEGGQPLGGLRSLLCDKDTSWVTRALAASFASFGERSAR